MSFNVCAKVLQAIFFYVHRSFVSMRFITVITQYQVTITPEFQALTRCMNVSYVGHERANGL
jgi:hypothetical protein